MWEREHDLPPEKKTTGHQWGGYISGELRTNRLDQALLTIADYAAGSPLPSESVHRARHVIIHIAVGYAAHQMYQIIKILIDII